MITKRVLRPERLRKVPEGFNWVDHRLVRQDYIRRCDVRALGLYLLLVTVSDERGLSYYSDEKTARLLGLNRAEVLEARRQLMAADLVAYECPVYQVLDMGGRP